MKLKQAITIVDYGVGNTLSVSNAIRHLGYQRLRISDDANVLSASDVIILPGVGAFEEAVRNLKDRSLDQVLSELVLVKRRPILGICVGMQLMATCSYENGRHEGLGWIEGEVVQLEPEQDLAVPHVGWNDVHFRITRPMFSRNTDPSNFYFDHSYWFRTDQAFVAAYCQYGGNITAAVQRENICGVQFHPEKSHNSGLRFFRSFLESV